MTIGISGNVSPGFGRYIQADVFHRMNRKISRPDNITDNIAGCANEDLALAVKDFVAAPDKIGCVNGIIHTQSQASLPEDLRNAKTGIENREIFKSILGMLSTKADNFSSTEKACYQKLCDRLCSEIKKEPGNVSAQASLKQQIKDIDTDDKQFWIGVAPLLNTYGQEIIPDLTAHILNQSVNAWCEYHNVTDREWARANICEIFGSNIRLCFNIIDDEISALTKEANAAAVDGDKSHGPFIRFICMKIFDAVATIPLSLRRQAPVGAGKPNVSEPVSGMESTKSPVNGHQTPGSFGNITFNGGNASATSYGGNTPTTPKDPWSSMAEALLASDKLHNDQRVSLLRDLIATMGERREIAPYIARRYPLLGNLNTISMQDLPGYSTLPKETAFTHAASAGDLREQQVRAPRLPRAHASALESAVGQAFANIPTAPKEVEERTHSDQVKRRISTSSSIGSGMSVMSEPRSPLANFTLDSLSPKQNIYPLASLSSYQKQGADISAIVAENGHAANDDFHLSMASSRSDVTSSGRGSSSDINMTDLALLKRWLGDEAKDETANIDELILRDKGLYTRTLEHFLERAFLAEAGTEELSDKQQAYINESFRKMQLHDDFSKLSRSAQALVEKYSQKRNSRVFTTMPGVRRTLSTQISRP